MRDIVSDVWPGERKMSLLLISEIFLVTLTEIMLCTLFEAVEPYQCLLKVSGISTKFEECFCNQTDHRNR